MKITKHASTGTNYAILTKQIKVQHETCIKFKSYAHDKVLSKHLENLMRFSFRKNDFLIGKKIMVETISVAISDSCDVLCFDLYLINIFTKSTKAEGYTDVMFKLTLYCLSVTVGDLNL